MTGQEVVALPRTALDAHLDFFRARGRHLGF